MYRNTLAEGGTTPIVITEDSGGDKSGFGGGGVLVVLLFLIVIAVVAIPAFTRREPVVQPTSGLAELLPAMMVMQSTSQRQTVDVNSNNTYGNGCGPSNFQLYQQGVQTNDNVFVQSCQTRELVREDGNTTRNLINDNRMHDLELQVAAERAEKLALSTQLTSERQYTALTQQNTANYNSLQQQLYALAAQVPKEPVPAVCVSPYASYRPGTVFAEPAVRFDGFRDGDCRGREHGHRC